MAVKFANRVKVATSTTGTGALTLGTPIESYQSFADGGILDGNSVRYTIVEANDWEVGTGVYTHSGTTMSRSLEESSTGSLMNLTGDAEVFITTAAVDIDNLGSRSLDYFYFTATSSQTVFTGNDSNSNQLAFYDTNIIVFLNGIALEGNGADYTASTHNTVTLTVGATSGDEVNIIAFKAFTMADAVSRTAGGVFDANVDFSAGIDVTGDITVTGNVDGRDVAADGTKLDGIETAATADQTASELLAAIITVDGTGSLLDADLLDGNHASAFATAAQGTLADTATQPGDLATVATTGAYADLTGTPTGLATETFVGTAISNLVDTAPATLDTLNELAAALGDDPNFATTTATAIGNKVAKAGDTMTGNLSFGDNNKAIFGAGSDLEIYHDGSFTYIKENGTGDLRILGSTNVQIWNSALDKQAANFNAGGGQTLYYNNAAKLATAATGIDVTGVITTDGMTTSADINFGDNNKAIFGAGSDLQIYHNSANNKSYIEESGSGNLVIRGSDIDILAGNGEAAINVAQDGAVTLYHDNAAKLATTTTGISVTGNATFPDGGKAIFGAGSDLSIYHDGSNSYIDEQGTGNLFIRASNNLILEGSTGENYFSGVSDGAVTLYYDSAAKLATTATGIDVTGTVNATAFTGSGSGLTNVNDGTKLPLAGGTMTGNTLVNNYGIGNVGLYSSTVYQAVWAMGDSYKLPADGSTTGGLYGIAWTHPNVSGQSKAGLSHQALFMEAGTTKTAIGTGIWTSGTVTATAFVGDGSGLTGLGGGFPAGTRMVFQQTSAPTGWTKDTTAAINNSALRFVTGTAGSGGSVAFTTAFASQAVTGTNGVSGSTTLTTAQMPSHNHSAAVYYYDGGGMYYFRCSQAINYYNSPSVSSTGGGGSHNHGAASFTGNAINLTVKYYDLIIGVKN